MLVPLERLSPLDILSASLVAIATGLGASVGMIAPQIPLEAVPSMAIVIALAVVFASLGVIIQGISMNRVADEIDPDLHEEDSEVEQIPEKWYREQVQRAHREGYHEGRLQGYEEGIERGVELASELGAERDPTDPEQGNVTGEEITTPQDGNSLGTDQSTSESSRDNSNDINEHRDPSKESEAERYQSSESREQDDELERELEEERD